MWIYYYYCLGMFFSFCCYGCLKLTDSNNMQFKKSFFLNKGMGLVLIWRCKFACKLHYIAETFKSVTTEIKSMIDPCFSKFVFEPDDILVQKPSSVSVVLCFSLFVVFYTFWLGSSCRRVQNVLRNRTNLNEGINHHEQSKSVNVWLAENPFAILVEAILYNCSRAVNCCGYNPSRYW